MVAPTTLTQELDKQDYVIMCIRSRQQIFNPVTFNFDLWPIGLDLRNRSIQSQDESATVAKKQT